MDRLRVSEAVLKEAESVPDAPSEADLERLDLREMKLHRRWSGHGIG